MFRRLINNNVKTIGIRRLSNNCNNHRIVEELQELNRKLSYIYFSAFTINVTLCAIALKS
jgi:hypothetical protein